MLRGWLLFTLAAVCALHSVQAQINLVPNPSFEEQTACPFFYPDLDGICTHWVSFSGTPDYFSECSSSCGYENAWGYQPARTGNSYGGFIVYDPIPNYREHLGIKLNQPLQVGVRYYVSFYVSLAYQYTYMNVAGNKTGARFTMYSYYNEYGDSSCTNSSHIYTNTIITDTLNWVQVCGSFIADSAYEYVVVGCFFDDAHIDTINLPFMAIPQTSYYYIDDVCVSTDPTLCGIDTNACRFALPTAFSPNGDGKNDEYQWVCNSTKVSTYTMRIYNRWGEKVFESTDPQLGWDGSYADMPQPVGLYWVYVTAECNGKQSHQSTAMHLLR